MTTSRKRNIQVTIFLVVSSFVAAHLCFWLLPSVFEIWNAKTIDQLFMFQSNSKQFRTRYDDTIVHVDINDVTLRQLKTFYLNRSHYTRGIRNLSEMKVALQLYDFIFAEPSTDKEDRAFIEATLKAGIFEAPPTDKLIESTLKAGNVYFGLVFKLLGERDQKQTESKSTTTEDMKYLDTTKWQVKTEGGCKGFYVGTDPFITSVDLAHASKGIGHLNIKSDKDGVFRRMPLLVLYKEAFYPSLFFRAICDYLNVQPETILVKPGTSITLKDAKRPEETEKHDIAIPIDRNGNMIINLVGWERMRHYNFVDILRASRNRNEIKMWRDKLSGKIVVVSNVSTGASDIGSVPIDINFPLSGLHSNVMNTILTESFFKELSDFEMFFIELLLMLIILLFSLRLSSLPFSLGTLALSAAYFCIVLFFFFYQNIIFHTVKPLIMVTFALISIVGYRYINEEKEKEILRKSFEAYFPTSVVEKIMTNPKTITSGGRKKELTILFSDIKDFTSYSSTMEPDYIQKLLNEYFEAMTEIIFKYKGTLDKFIGDGLMVFFGDPDPQPDHALLCVKAAIEMQQKVREIRAKWEKTGSMPIQIRIGISTGTVVVGNMGSSMRLSYTVIGSAVNLAQRLESNAPVDGILISKRTNDFVKEHITTKSLGPIQCHPLTWAPLLPKLRG